MAKKVLTLACVVVGLLVLAANPAWAYVDKQKDPDEPGKIIERGGPDHPVFSGAAIGAGIGAGVTILGAGLGLGRIGSAALESMARQPEVAGRVQTGMIIIAALLEGVTFFSLIVCIIVAGKAIW
jgi:F-type H+-transporting ATPase subunit c